MIIWGRMIESCVGEGVAFAPFFVSPSPLVYATRATIRSLMAAWQLPALRVCHVEIPELAADTRRGWNDYHSLVADLNGAHGPLSAFHR